MFTKKTVIKNSLFLILLLFFISATLFLIRYNFLLNAKFKEAKKNTKIISSTIIDNFNYAEKILNFVGQKISDHDNPNDLKFIYNLFEKTASMNNIDNQIFSWSKFDWVDKNNSKP